MRIPKSLVSLVLALSCAAPALAADSSKVFRYAFEVAETGFDPAEISDLYSSNVIANLFDTPLTYDYLARPVKLVPNTLAAMPEITENGTVYTMRVKPGIYFVDDPVFKGKKRELVAEDFTFSIKRIFDPKKRSPNLYYLEGNIAGMDEVLAKARKENKFDYDTPIEGLRTIDKYTFQVRLKQPDYNFLYFLAYCNLTCAVAREVVEHYGDKVAEHPVGTGPYKLAFWKRSSKMVFEANPNYREEFFDGAPPADDAIGQAILAANKGKKLPMVGKIEVYVIEEHQPRYLAFLNNEFDLLERLPADFANVAIPNNTLAGDLKRRGVHMQRTAGIEITYSYFGMKDPIVGGYEPEKIALRRAIVLGQDVDAEVTIVRKNQAIAAQSPIGPGALGYDPNFRSTASEFSPSKAKALLDMYGYIDCNNDGWRDLPRKSPADECKPFSVEYASAPNAQQKPLDENWKKNMDAIGIQMTFKKEKWPDLLKQSKLGKLQMWGLGWTAAVPDAWAFFVMLYGPNGGQANHSRFSHPEFDRLFEQSKRLPDGPERNAIYREMNRIFLVYAPWRLGTHRILTDLSQPWAIGFRRHPVMRGFWKYVDIDQPKYAAAGGK
ncbi:ABC transporter substrate-binding protein [Usitatibacter palustris]|uniref:Periplasmic dipeptide transport protein n=1 Tax=Usitatibacter palustris TaxID=2732487 RepID=A0A6M4H7Q4_9PROT|nr:ABC transporter substrate-binding protein [Usitatibacter palustris]QJR15646.1 Periplasmic dipeptide transport protein [Usitatibacter palustris]